MPLYEGELYGLRVQITNNSFRQGVSAGADLTIVVDARTPTAVAIDNYSWVGEFGPAEQKGFSVTLNIPEGTAGETLVITVGVYAPNNRLLAQDSAEYSISTAPEPEPEPEPFDPWVYDTNGDGVIDVFEVEVAYWDWRDGIITQNQLDMVHALIGSPPGLFLLQAIVGIVIDPIKDPAYPLRGYYEAGEIVTLTCGRAGEVVELIINEEGQWREEHPLYGYGEVYWSSIDSIFAKPGYYTRWRIRGPSPLVVTWTMRANTWGSCWPA